MITNFPSGFANAIAPFAPPGGQPVGQENAELRATSFKPVEQLANPARTENRRSPGERANDAGEQERLREGRDQLDGNEYQQKREQQQKQEAEAKGQRLELEQKEIRQLAARDREVRAHEQAHAAVGGKYAGSPVYEFVRGPDGISYAVGGEVSISTSPIPGNPEATIAKAQQILRAANAPSDPSPQDRRVAADAAQMEAQARVQLRQQETLENRKESPGQADAKQVVEMRKEEQAQIQSQLQQNRLQQSELQKEQREIPKQQAADSAELFFRPNLRGIDINRRLFDSGVNSTSSSVGSLLNKTA